jgi:hypothetical protein
MAVADIPPPVRHLRYVAAVHPTPARIKHAMSEVDGFNAKFAVLVTRLVGSMWCAYLFCLIARVSLPAILIDANVLTKGDVPQFLAKPGLILIVAWIAQTFIQLVLLSVIMVGQSVQSAASDARSEQTYEDTVKIIDALNVKTEGGIRELRDELLAAIEKIKPA